LAAAMPEAAWAAQKNATGARAAAQVRFGKEHQVLS